MTPPLSFDIVLATLGRSAELERLLASLAAQTHAGLRLVVVDQNPDERLAPVLEPYEGRLSIVRLRSPPGLSRARNTGLHVLRGDVVAFADDDCWYPSDLFARLSDLLQANPGWDGVTGRVTDGLGQPSSARWSAEAGVVDRTNVWTRGVSISAFLRRGVVDRVGGFDEELGAGSGTPWGSGEETDYLLRAIEQRFTVYYDPELVVFHPDNRAEPTAATIAAGRLYGAGMGRVLRKHDYPAWFAAYHVARGLGGAAIALARRRPAEARFHLAVARGRASGWFAAGLGP